MNADFLLYGSYGYTGRLIAERAREQGLTPLLAGRNRDALQRQATELDLPFQTFNLGDAAALDAALAAVPVVLHAAGPFAHTAQPVADACLRTGTHYLDITGEIEAFERLAARGADAEAAGVMLLPGVGFDVVPSDCLAAHLKQRLPTATTLELAFAAAGGSISRGTARTMIENLDGGGAVRRAGRITPVPTATLTREVDFGRGPTLAVAIPWGDVATAWYSTGIPNITVYTRMPASALRVLRASRYMGPLLGSAPVQKALHRWTDRGKPGPSAEQRARGRSRLWGEVSDDAGNRAAARLNTPEGYTLTALTAVAAVRRVLAGDHPPGFQTPSLAYGADWILEIEGTEREDIG